jgi:penicillin-binding protein 1A
MRRITGGAAPAGIWHDYMVAALPRLKVLPIPGGDVAPPPPEEDGIGSIIDGVTGFLRGDRDEPPPSEFEDRPPPREQRRRDDPPF